MPVSSTVSSAYGLSLLKNAPVWRGIFTGVCLAAVFTLWVVVANRVPELELFARERNIAAVALLIFFASLPVVRFYRSPLNLLASGVLAWSMLTIAHLLLRLKFVQLDQNYSSFHIFMLGAVTYFILATLSWVGAIIWRVRTNDVNHSQH
jgi:hypothetical protein